MPTYAYACTECKHHFEIVQSFTDDSLTQCPRCQGKLRKLFNAVGVVFKGSGFYRTDSRSSGRSSVPGSSTSNGAREGSRDTGSIGAPSDGAVSTTGGDKGPTSSSGTSSGGSPVSAAPASSA